MSGKSDIPEKLSKTSNSVIAPSHTSDHVVAMTQLREQIATLQKKLQQKDNQLLQKDKEVSYKKNKQLSIFIFFFIVKNCQWDFHMKRSVKDTLTDNSIPSLFSFLLHILCEKKILKHYLPLTLCR